MRVSLIAITLFLLLTFGCFGSRGISDQVSDAAVSGNTDGSVERFDARITGGRRTNPTPPICGNAILNEDELCDGTNLAGATCGLLMPGYFGQLACTADCMNYDTSMCYQVADGDIVCGNNVKEEGELCDGTDLAGASCRSLLPDHIGTLGCYADCRDFDTSMCFVPPGLCGNNVKNAGEECDGTDFAGARCEFLLPGFIGTLGCTGTCHYDTSMCFEEVDDGGV